MKNLETTKLNIILQYIYEKVYFPNAFEWVRVFYDNALVTNTKTCKKCFISRN